MKTISLSLAAALVLSVAAFAQTPKTSDTNHSNSDIMQNNAPANNTPSAATDKNDTAPAGVSQACTKQASDKKLMGDDKTKFLKDCKAGKTTRSGN